MHLDSQNISYLIIGNGRLAKHVCHYFNKLAVTYQQWHRPQSEQLLDDLMTRATHILVLISDDAIDAFIEEHELLRQNKCIVHCSGALVSRYAFGAHPLQTFGPTLYSFEEYQKIAFIIEEEGPGFQELLPGLSNNSYSIKRVQKPFYHALCVMANNFTTLVWQRFFEDFKNKLGIPEDAIFPILDQTFKNIKADYALALTGPLARGDHKTLQKNMDSLVGHEFEAIFKAVIESVQV